MKHRATGSMTALERWRMYLKIKRLVRSGLSWSQIVELNSEIWNTRQAAHRWYRDEEKFWGPVTKLVIKSKD